MSTREREKEKDAPLTPQEQAQVDQRKRMLAEISPQDRQGAGRRHGSRL